MSETSDAYLVSLIKDPASKDKAFLQLMDAYKKPLYWHIRRLVVLHEDAEDILQETFINVYRFADSFKGESKVYSWLYRIATNECTKHFRKNKNWIKRAELVADQIIGGLTENDNESSDAILGKFQKAILQLPEKQRIVFNLRYYDELSYEDMSQILNTSVNALKTNYHYASVRIKQFLIDHS